MAQRSSSNVAVIVAVIGVLGTISAAVIANWDKIVGSGSAEPVHVNQTPHNEAAPLPSPDKVNVTPAQTANAPIDISGTWRDDDGYSYDIRQTGDRYHLTQFLNGAEVGTGDGHVDGSSLTHDFTAINPLTGGQMQGVCNVQLSADARRMGGLCRSGTTSWPVAAYR